MSTEPTKKYRGVVPYTKSDGEEHRIVQGHAVDSLDEARAWCADQTVPQDAVRGFDTVHIEER